MNPNNSLTDAQVHLFFLNVVLSNATPVTNAFLSCTLFSICFFSGDVLGKHVGPSSIIFDIPVSV